jgi:ABC-type polysaccharide/polyol phosphate export permease
LVFHVFAYWFMRYRRTWRSTIVISVANPLLFLVGVGAGLGHLVNHHAPAQMGGVPYAAFFAPGLLAASAMQTAFLESAGQVVQASAPSGAYQSTVATPLSPEQVMAGHMLYVAFRVLTSSAAFVLVMAGFGLVSGARAAAVLIAATLTGVAFATPAAAWSVGVRAERQIYNVFRMLIVPLYMFSGTFFALSELPGPVRVLVEALPLAQGATLCRSLALGTAGAPAIAAHAVYLCALTVIGFALARTAYRRRLHA